MKRLIDRSFPLIIFSLPFLLATRFELSLLDPEGDSGRSLALTTALLKPFRFGVDIVFSHGPLMFLNDRLFSICPLPFWSVFFGVVIKLWFGGLLWGWVKVLKLSPGWALGFALLITGIVSVSGIESESAIIMLCAGLSGLLVMGQAPRCLPVLLGLLTAVTLLNKTSLGIAVVATTAISLTRWWYLYRRVETPVIYIASALGATGLLWWGIGQRLGDLLPYVLNSSAVVRGYPYMLGMGIKAEWWIIGGYALTTLLLALFVFRNRSREVVSLATVLLFPLAISFKHSVVRMGPVHLFHFIAFAFFCVGLLFFLAAKERKPDWGNWGIVVVIVLVLQLVPATTAYYRDGGLPLYLTRLSQVYLTGPGRSGRAVRAIADNVFHCTKEAELDSSSGVLTLPEALRHQIGERTADVWTDNLSLIFANHLNWAPRPTITELLTAEPAADRLDDAFLHSDRATEVILMDVTHTDLMNVYDFGTNGIYNFWSEPLSFLTLLSAYKPFWDDKNILALERTSEPRLQRGRELGSEIVKTNEEVKIPEHRSDELVFARVKVVTTPVEKVQAFMVRPSRIRINAKRQNDSRLLHFTYSNSSLGILLGSLPIEPKELKQFFCDFSGSTVQSLRFENTVKHLVAKQFEVSWFTRVVEVPPCPSKNH